MPSASLAAIILTLLTVAGPAPATDQTGPSGLRTPFERGNGNQTATYAEAIAFYTQLADANPRVSLHEMGPTDSGEPLHLVLIADPLPGLAELKTDGRSILLINNAIGVCIASVAVVWVWIWPTPTQWALMAAIGCAMAVAQTCFVNAMARADASFVAPLTYGTLIFAAVYDVLFYDVIPDGITILGASIIVAGALLLAWREAIKTRSKHDHAPL